MKKKITFENPNKEKHKTKQIKTAQQVKQDKTKKNWNLPFIILPETSIEMTRQSEVKEWMGQQSTVSVERKQN